MACAETVLALSLMVSILLNMILLFSNLAEKESNKTDDNTTLLLEVAPETNNETVSQEESTT